MVETQLKNMRENFSATVTDCTVESANLQSINLLASKMVFVGLIATLKNRLNTMNLNKAMEKTFRSIELAPSTL